MAFRAEPQHVPGALQPHFEEQSAIKRRRIGKKGTEKWGIPYGAGPQCGPGALRGLFEEQSAVKRRKVGQRKRKKRLSKVEVNI